MVYLCIYNRQQHDNQNDSDTVGILDHQNRSPAQCYQWEIHTAAANAEIS